MTVHYLNIFQNFQQAFRKHLVHNKMLHTKVENVLPAPKLTI